MAGISDRNFSPNYKDTTGGSAHWLIKQQNIDNQFTRFASSNFKRPLFHLERRNKNENKNDI